MSPEAIVIGALFMLNVLTLAAYIGQERKLRYYKQLAKQRRYGLTSGERSEYLRTIEEDKHELT